MSCMRHPAPMSWWFFPSWLAGPQNYSDFCFALQRVWFHNPARDVHQTHLEMSQCSVSLCPDFPWAEHAKPSHFHCAKQINPCCWHQQEIIEVAVGRKRGELTLTPLHKLGRTESSSEGQVRTNLGQDKEYFSPFSCQPMVSMRRKFGSRGSMACGKNQTVQVKSFNPGSFTLLLQRSTPGHSHPSPWNL